MSAPISTIMHDQVTSIGMDASVAEVEALLQAEHISAVPVVGNGGLILGILSMSDIVQLDMRNRDPARTKAWEICSYRPIEVAPDTPIGEVARLMLIDNIHHVVVMEHATLKGIVSSLDFVKLVAEQDLS